ncbi:hypothetical protein B9G55_14540 [Saccharibacillus sp. O16]|nr:hypothetical protein B9G55_14540 [Saccharibacillus sp. O16]
MRPAYLSPMTMKKDRRERLDGLGRVFKPRWKQILPNFRAKQGTFLKACRGTSKGSDAVEREKTVKDAHQQV